MPDAPSNSPTQKRARLLGWWYVCIGIAFGALGLRSLVAGDRPWSVALRGLIAAGFIVLGVETLRSARLRSRR